MRGDSPFRRHGKSWVSALLRLYLIVLVAIAVCYGWLAVIYLDVFLLLLAVVSLSAFGCIGIAWLPAIKAREFYFRGGFLYFLLATVWFFSAIIISAFFAQFLFGGFVFHIGNDWHLFFLISTVSHVIIQVLSFLTPLKSFRHS